MRIIKLNTMVKEIFDIGPKIRKVWCFKEQLIIYVNLFTAKIYTQPAPVYMGATTYTD